MIFASIRSEDIPFRAGQQVKVHPVTMDGEPWSIVIRDFEQTNEVNPILVAFREYEARHPLDTHRLYWLSALHSLEAFGGHHAWDHPGDEFHALTLATDAQADHARRVLTRLARLSEEPS